MPSPPWASGRGSGSAFQKISVHVQCGLRMPARESAVGFERGHHDVRTPRHCHPQRVSHAKFPSFNPGGVHPCQPQSLNTSDSLCCGRRPVLPVAVSVGDGPGEASAHCLLGGPSGVHTSPLTDVLGTEWSLFRCPSIHCIPGKRLPGPIRNASSEQCRQGPLFLLMICVRPSPSARSRPCWPLLGGRTRRAVGPRMWV